MYIVNAINTTCVFSALVTTLNIVYYTCTYKFRIVLSSAVHMIRSFLNTICVVPALMTTLSMVYCTYSKRNKSTMYCSGQNYCELFSLQCISHKYTCGIKCICMCTTLVCMYNNYTILSVVTSAETTHVVLSDCHMYCCVQHYYGGLISLVVCTIYHIKC